MGYPKMKLSSLSVLGFTFSAGVNAFIAPQNAPAFAVSNRFSSDAQGTALNMGVRSFFGKSKNSNILVAPEISDDEVRSLFDLWNDALQTGNSKIVAKRYSSDPMLLPTVSDTPRTDFDTIKDYFDAFLKKKPSGTILEGKITKGYNRAGLH